jgi:hypothetical protein
MLGNTLGDTASISAHVKQHIGYCQEHNIPYYQWNFSSNGFLNTSGGDRGSNMGQRKFSRDAR